MLYRMCMDQNRRSRGRNTVSTQTRLEFNSAEAEVRLLLSVEPLDWSTFKQWVVMTKKHNLLWCTSPEHHLRGQRPQLSWPALLGLLTQLAPSHPSPRTRSAFLTSPPSSSLSLALKQRHSLLNKSNTVMPERDKCGLTTDPVCFPRTRASVKRKMALV